MSGRAAGFGVVVGVVAVLLGGLTSAHPAWAQAEARGDSGHAARSNDSLPPSAAATPQRKAFYFYPVPTGEQLTGLKITLVGAYLWRTALDGTTRPSTIFHHSAFTTKHQVLIGFGGDQWSPQNTRHLNFGIEYSRFPAPFFGIGPRTSQAACQEAEKM